MSARVYLARWIVPISSPPTPDGAVAVEGERIVYVGTRTGAPAGEVVDLGNAVLTPGLVNAHTHLELTAFRGLLEDLPFRRWIVGLTKSRSAVMTPERHLASARLGIAEGLLRGVTSYADCTANGHTLTAMAEMEVRGVVYHEVFGPDPGAAPAALAALRDAVGALRSQGVQRVTVGVSPHAPYSVSDALFAAVARYARSEDLPMAVHIGESAAETALVADGGGDFGEALRARGISTEVRAPTPIALLARLDVLGPRTLLIHAVRVSNSDLALIARSGSTVASCPASNAKLGHGVARLEDFATAGITVGLGSDSVASNNAMDILGEARLAVLLQRALTGRHDALPASRALHLATLGGALAVGLADRVGSLAVGKEADVAAFPMDELGDGSWQAPEELLLHGAPGRRACLTVVAGRELVRHGALVADVSRDQRIVAETAAALREAVSAGEPTHEP